MPDHNPLSDELTDSFDSTDFAIIHAQCCIGNIEQLLFEVSLCGQSALDQARLVLDELRSLKVRLNNAEPRV